MMEKNELKLIVLRSIKDRKFITADLVYEIFKEVGQAHVETKPLLLELVKERLISENSFEKDGMVFAGFSVNQDEINSYLGNNKWF